MKITYKEIAAAAGVSLSKVEGDRREGKFDKQDLKSIALYITNAVQARQKTAPTQHEADKAVPPVTPSEKASLPGFDWEE